MERESHERGGDRPAEEKSIKGFLSAIEQYTADGVLHEDTGTRGTQFHLPDGRLIAVWRGGIISEDISPNQAIAAMIVRELNGDEVLETGYLHYKDGRMEKDFRVSSRAEEKAQYLSAEDTLSDVVEMTTTILKKAREQQAAEKMERMLGLRAATEVDMRDTEELFRLIEEVREAGKENEAPN